MAFARNLTQTGSTDRGARLDAALADLWSRFEAPRFVQIGLGPTPRTDRLRALLDRGGSFAGFDLVQTCEKHKAILTREGLGTSDRLRFLGHGRGSYVFNLVTWFREGGRADVILLDGHRTLYVDLPALYVGWCALAEGGFLVIDRPDWKLATAASNMHASFDVWKALAPHYDFGLYEREELNQPHLALIRDVFLRGVHGMEPVPEAEGPDWSVLRKPRAGSGTSPRPF